MIVDGNDPASIAQAVATLQAGGLVGVPTETVYGLAADANNPDGVAAIFATKGRPADHPLIVHVAGVDGIAAFASEVPDFARRLVDAFWPGPLTIILPRREGVAIVATGGQASVGLRCPAHPVAHSLLQACASAGIDGLAAPSANRFGRVSPTTARHVADEFGDALLVLDGGPCPVGIESAIVDCTRGEPVMLRPGVLTRAQIAQAAGVPVREPHEMTDAAPRASGTLESHYAPQARVRLMDAAALQAGLDLLGADAARIAIWSRVVLRSQSRDIVRRRMPDDAVESARQLFAVLRDFDAQGVRLIWIESPPDTPEWDGVRDRLHRAAAG